jgi:hypothetical protein
LAIDVQEIELPFLNINRQSLDLRSATAAHLPKQAIHQSKTTAQRQPVAAACLSLQHVNRPQR